jgi:hypothetical protein
LLHFRKIVIVRQEHFFFLLATMLIQSERVLKALTLSNGKFKRLFGYQKATFWRMLETLQEAYETLHKLGGKPSKKMLVEDRLLVTLQYWREYRTMEHLAYDYDTVKSYIHKVIVWVEDILIQDGSFRLPGKKTLLGGQDKPRVIAIDVTEHPIERPKKSRKSTTRARESAIL